MLINIHEELKNRDLMDKNFCDLYNIYVSNSYTTDEKKKLAEALATNKSNKYIFGILNKEDKEAKAFGNIGNALFENYNNEDKIGKALNECCECNNDNGCHCYGLFSYRIGTTSDEDRLNLLNVCTAKSLYSAEEKLSPMNSEYVTEICNEDYDNFFAGNYQLLDEGPIWDAIKSGAKGVKDAIRDKVAGPQTQEVKDAKIRQAAAKLDYKKSKAETKYAKEVAKQQQIFDRASGKKQTTTQSSNQSKQPQMPTDISNPSKFSADAKSAIDAYVKDGNEEAIQNATKEVETQKKELEKVIAQLKQARADAQKQAQHDKNNVEYDDDNPAAESYERKNMIKLKNINEETTEQSYKVVYTDSQIVRSKSPSGAVSEFKKNHEDATNVHIDTSYKPEDEKNESLIEELEDSELSDFGYTAEIMDIINDEYEAIDLYNQLLIALKDGNQNNSIAIIEGIIEEEYNHIGQLQTLLENYSDASGAIEDGIEEAEEQLGVAEETSIDDDFGNNSGFDIFM